MSERSVFMMFIVMYFAIHLKLKDNLLNANEQVHKDSIKVILNEIINNPEQRQTCINLFATNFIQLFFESDQKFQIQPKM